MNSKINHVSSFQGAERSAIRDHYRSIQLKKHYEKLEAMNHDAKLIEHVKKLANDQD